jgi:hypothetical protein
VAVALTTPGGVLSFLALQNSPVKPVPAQSHTGPTLVTTHMPAPQSRLPHAMTSSSMTILDAVSTMSRSIDDELATLLTLLLLLLPGASTSTDIEDSSASD